MVKGEKMKKQNTLKVVIGAGEYNNNPGWYHTQENELNVLDEASWQRNFSEESIDALLAEHVWEHLTYAEGLQAAKLAWEYLKPGGYFRCAVPDGYFPNQYYQKIIQEGGPGPSDHPAASHKIVHTYESFTRLFSEAGFECELLEYHDETGEFYQKEWVEEEGIIFRSAKVDPRNSQILTFPSLIVDAKKPLKVKFGGTEKEQNELAKKVITGEKTATSSLMYLQEIGKVSQTSIGDIWIIEDGSGNPKAKVKVTKVEPISFGKITEEFALLEGDGSYQNWYDIHHAYYGDVMKKYGQILTDETILECVYFNRI